MFTLNFKKRFSSAIETGEKRQTIRAPRKDGRIPRPGDDLRLYTGMRTSQCQRLTDATCTAIASVLIVEHGSDWMIYLDGRKLSLAEQIEFAKDDGFETWAEFLEFFNKVHGLPFAGLMIRWEPKAKERE